MTMREEYELTAKKVGIAAQNMANVIKSYELTNEQLQNLIDSVKTEPTEKPLVYRGCGVHSTFALGE